MKHNDDDRLTPEERSVIEAALEWGNGTGYVEALVGAVDAYRKATAPPEPFERYMALYGSSNWGAYQGTDPDYWHAVEDDATIWRCTVTPVERVR